MPNDGSRRSVLQNPAIPWIIAALAFALFVIANLPWQLDDYDQAKQAFTSFQMVNEGRWFFQTTPHERIATKPPLVGWVSASMYAATGLWELAWRLPSVIAAAAIGFLLFRSAKPAYGETGAVIALAAFAFNLITPRLATLARTDAPLAFTVWVVGLLIWHKIRSQDDWKPNDRWIVFFALTAAMLIKGPVVLAFLLPAIVAFELWRKRPSVSAFPGMWPWILSLVIFLVWVGAGIRIVPNFYEDVVVREFFGRFGGEAHRSQPVLFYVPHLLHKFAPWSLLMLALAAIELRTAGWNWRRLQISAPTRWLICWSFGGFLVMSLFPSKRVDRIFPVLPPLCMLLGAQISSVLSRSRVRQKIVPWTAATLAASLLISGGYFCWKASSGYREHRGALSEFGSKVRSQAAGAKLRYGIVSAPDESLLLYLRHPRFIVPERAIADWRAAGVDALVVSTRDAPELMAQLEPVPITALKSEHRDGSDMLDYLFITKSPR